MDKINSKYDLKLIFTKFRRMYFTGYQFIFMFSATFTEKYLFLKLMYRAFNQQGFKPKLLRFPLKCHLEKDLKLILHNIYQKNIELEFIDHTLTQREFLKAMVDSIEDHDMFDLPTITEEERWFCYESPLTRGEHQKFRIYLLHPKHLQNEYSCDFQLENLSYILSLFDMFFIIEC